MEAFRVPKRRAAIELVLLDGTVMSADVFLSERAESHEGPERVSDLLERGPWFVPAVVGDGEALTFVNKASVAYVKTDGQAEPEDGGAPTLSCEHGVDVHLNDGRVLRGGVSYVLPPDRARLNDYLNGQQNFLRLLQDGEVLLVNKRHVGRVVLLAGR